jgi:glyoxylase-like metal-dependent hydrolase (beta-lactamase superfamily II)
LNKVRIVDVFKFREPNAIACYVLCYERPVLIDPGPLSGVQCVIEELKRLKVSPKTIALTHVHLDHASGAATLAKLFSAKVLVHPRGAKHLVDPTKLWEASKMVLKELANVFGKPEPLQEDMVLIAEDHQRLDLGGDELLVLYAPGHAPHMLAYYLKDAKVLFPADAVGACFDGHLIPSTPPPFDYDEALATLKRLRRLNVEFVALTHFGLADREVIEKAENKIREWYEMATICNNLEELIKRLRKEDEDVKSLYERYPEDSMAISFFKTSAQGIFECAKGSRAF